MVEFGSAFVRSLAEGSKVATVFATSRNEHWCRQDVVGVRKVPVDLTNEDSLKRLATMVKEEKLPLRLVINCTGLLHDDSLQPERSWRELNAEHMARSFQINTIGVGLTIKHIVPLIPRRGRSVFVSLSARVGSIGDNRLGGWYSYRASKAAQNKIIKCAAIEATSRKPDLIMATLHPGTVATDLSEPFRKRISHEVFSAEDCCSKLSAVIAKLKTADSGGHFAWDGSPIPW